MSDQVLCKVLVEFGMGDRTVTFVSTSAGALGILVKDQSGSPLIPLEPDFPGMTAVHAPAIVKNAMMLMAMSKMSDATTLIRCLHIAVIMVSTKSREQQHELLSVICDADTVEYMISKGWKAATDYVPRIFQGQSDIEIREQCALHFPDNTLGVPPTLQ